MKALRNFILLAGIWVIAMWGHARRGLYFWFRRVTWDMPPVVVGVFFAASVMTVAGLLGMGLAFSGVLGWVPRWGFNTVNWIFAAVNGYLLFRNIRRAKQLKG